MSRDADDLLPLFLDEAAGRLERLRGLLPAAVDEPDAAVQVRRELHALKGAARLLGLRDVADLCHRAEDGMTGEVGEGMGSTRLAVERVAEIVEELRRANGGGGSSPEAETPGSGERPVIRGGSGELRVATEVVDDLAERSARMKIVAAAGQAAAAGLLELAGLAERGHADRTLETLAQVAAEARRAALEIEGTSRTLGRLGAEQLDALLALQVQELRPFLRTLARHTGELARALDKEVEVTTSGGDVQLDRRILEAIREAALHLVRNAVDHGIESAAERIEVGKTARGRIHFGAVADGDRVRLEVTDDGRGIDPEAVRRLAVERGLVNPAAAAELTEAEIYQLLELPGFTTRELATDLSGRGVGLDAVAASFRSIGGDLWIRSTPGKGTRVVVELPVARRGERVLVVRVGGLVVAFPSSVVRSYRRLDPGGLVEGAGRTVVRQRGGAAIPAVVLATIFGEPEPVNAVIVETTVAGRPAAVIVDAVLGDEEVFVRPLPPVAGAPAPVEGLALLASGAPVAVLALQRLGPIGLDDLDGPRRGPSGRGAVRVLLTDDTAATREMLRRLLEDAGFTVRAVATAEEALGLVEAEPFDCVVTGVELPGLSGIELVRRVRSSDLYADLPVVVVSTRDRPADRLEGLEAGADAYLAKQEIEPDELASLIRRLTADLSS
ncbi:MAG: response regulator [Thermoanaerobaculales bacterium]|nr:response regulator [Thermoanaerobaculales bacterium]